MAVLTADDERDGRGFDSRQLHQGHFPDAGRMVLMGLYWIRRTGQNQRYRSGWHR